jgi:hypothetical protein
MSSPQILSRNKSTTITRPIFQTIALARSTVALAIRLVLTIIRSQVLGPILPIRVGLLFVFGITLSTPRLNGSMILEMVK